MNELQSDFLREAGPWRMSHRQDTAENLTHLAPFTGPGGTEETAYLHSIGRSVSAMRQKMIETFENERIRFDAV